MWKVLSFLFVIAKLSGAVVFDINKECKIEGYTTCEGLDYSNANEIVVNLDQIYPEVKGLRVQDSKFRVIPRNLFTVLPNLEILTLSEGIVKIEKNDFINANKLKSLDLSSNSIEELPEKVFQYVPNLETLTIGKNNIHEIHPTAFAGLTKLKMIFLPNNTIKSLPVGVFDDLISVQVLKMDDNQIESIDENLFRNNQELQILSLENNRISQIGQTAFTCLSKLQSLMLANNTIEEIHLNSIYVLYIQSCGVKKLVIDGFVQNLNAAGNEISELKIQDVSGAIWMILGVTRDVDLTFLKDAKSLKTLTFYGGSPNLQGLSAIREMPNLTELSIQNADITEIPNNIFDHLKNVESLQITGNPLQTVNVNEILKLKKLQYLSLADNRIEDLDYKTILDTSAGLMVFDLRNNRFKCSYMAEILSYMEEKHIMPGFIISTDDLPVFNPNEHDIGCIEDRN